MTHVRDEPFTNAASAGDPYFARRLVREPYSTPPAHRFVFLTRDFYGLYVILAGSMAMEVLGSDGKVRVTELAPGRIYLWRPQDRRPLGASNTEAIDFVEVGIRAGEWQEFTSFLRISSARQTAVAAPVAVVPPAEQAEITAAFEGLTQTARAGATVVELARFLSEMVPRVFPPSAMTDDGAPEWLFASVEAMRDEDNLRVGLPRFLELARVSSRQLSRITNQYLGTTPGAILAEARLQHAMRLLRVSGDTIALIAERCGYGTAAHFSNRFRDATGMSPRAFRQRALQGFAGARAREAS